MILLDTHAFLWWLSDPTKLPKKATRAVKNAPRVLLSDISLWEVAMLESKGRIVLDRPLLPWLNEALAEPRVEVAAITPNVAVQSTRLGAFHPDPADRIIVATAMVEGIPLITADERIHDFGSVTTIWD